MYTYLLFLRKKVLLHAIPQAINSVFQISRRKIRMHIHNSTSGSAAKCPLNTVI